MILSYSGPKLLRHPLLTQISFSNLRWRAIYGPSIHILFESLFPRSCIGAANLNAWKATCNSHDTPLEEKYGSFSGTYDSEFSTRWEFNGVTITLHRSFCRSGGRFLESLESNAFRISRPSSFSYRNH